jgi:FkbM family methyltransferase
VVSGLITFMNWIRLLKDLPLRFNEERSEQIANRHLDGWRRIYLSESAFVVCPDDALVVSIWRFHFFSRGGRAELNDFFALSANCNRLLDIGASAGIFSALFANTRERGQILSVEPDEKSFRLLQQTGQLNSCMKPEWRKLRAVVTDKPGKQRFHSVGFGGTISRSEADEEIAAHNLESLSSELGFVPDLIKLDVESYEYEIVMGSLSWLEAHHPLLFLELHWRLLEQRNLSPGALLQKLADLGYRCHGKANFPSKVCNQLDEAGVARLALAFDK